MIFLRFFKEKFIYDRPVIDSTFLQERSENTTMAKKKKKKK